MGNSEISGGLPVKMSYQNVNTPVLPSVATKPRGKAGVFFGKDNLFPQEIINFIAKSPIQGSIIQSTAVYVRGRGVNRVDRYVGEPNSEYDYETLLKRTASDYKTFGGFAWQIIPSKDKKNVHIYHHDFSEVRALELDDTGTQVKVWGVSKNWKNTTGKHAPVPLENWQTLDSAEEKAYLFVYWDYRAGMSLYCVPDWFAGMDAVRTDGNLGVFWFSSVDNGFAPSAIVSCPTKFQNDGEQRQFEENVRDSLSGTHAGGKIAFMYGNMAGTLPQVTAFDASKNADMYNNVDTIVFQRIITANRLSSPTLAGLSGSGNLSGNAQEIIDSFILYSYTVIDEYRRTILNELNKFVKLNGFDPLEILDLEVVEKIKEANGITDAPQASTTADNTQIVAQSSFMQNLKKILKKWK